MNTADKTSETAKATKAFQVLASRRHAFEKHMARLARKAAKFGVEAPTYTMGASEFVERYSVDEEWFVPHFEKMLYDQAQLATACLEAKQGTGREVFAWLARDILEYVRRELTAPDGGFYSAEDADSLLRAGEAAHAEGAFYVWSAAEIDARFL